jgi:2-amino-4-hydroxy-6-hydroxymethyldihydropteridine diphosphokinase
MLEKARNKLCEFFGEVYAMSSLYETAAWGLNKQPVFLNQALVFNTNTLPLEILSLIKNLEIELGRLPRAHWDKREIDIDIILYGETIFKNEILQIPHPQMANRRFVLEPICEILPELVHPELNLTMTTLLSACTDPLKVQKLDSDIN